MDSQIWVKLHGASTHLPVAMVLCASVCDAAAVLLWTRPLGRDLRTAGHYMWLAGAAGSVLTVISGLVMTKGEMLGHGALRWHHLFAWPAFGLIVALAVWRLLAGRQASRRGFACYVAVALLTAGLTAAVGYWGGEMAISSGLS